MKLINLPNIITCCNLLCGCMAVFFGLHGMIVYACLCIVFGAVFDFFDGMTARALQISGPIGKELDSLADMVSFGVAPSVLAYQSVMSLSAEPAFPAWIHYPIVLFSMVIAAFSALRLAKFNCDERQSLSFIGLPTPANALFWIGFVNLCQLESVQQWAFDNQYMCGSLWSILVIVMSCLLICELPMFSLKIKPGHNGFKENSTRYIFLATTVLILIVSVITIESQYLLATAAPIILLYILFSVYDAITKRS